MPYFTQGIALFFKKSVLFHFELDLAGRLFQWNQFKRIIQGESTYFFYFKIFLKKINTCLKYRTSGPQQDFLALNWRHKNSWTAC